LAAIKVNVGPLETVLLANTDTGMDRQKQVGMKTGISRPEQSAFLLVGEKPYFVVVFRFPFNPGRWVFVIFSLSMPTRKMREKAACQRLRLDGFQRRCSDSSKPADNFLLRDFLGNPVTKYRQQSIDLQLKLVRAFVRVLSSRVFQSVSTESAEKNCLSRCRKFSAFEFFTSPDGQQVDCRFSATDLLSTSLALQIEILDLPNIRTPWVLIYTAQLFPLPRHEPLFG
jgi:hypothetical protein